MKEEKKLKITQTDKQKNGQIDMKQGQTVERREEIANKTHLKIKKQTKKKTDRLICNKELVIFDQI